VAVVAGLYVQHALALLQTRSQAQNQLAIVQRLARQNAALIKEGRSLSDPTTIQQRARALGMVRPGERSYAITDLPSR
jgi:cell division protein FtsB